MRTFIFALFLTIACVADASPDPKGVAMHQDPKSLIRAFSFVYDGRDSAELLPKLKSKFASRRLDENRTRIAWTWTDPATGLRVRSEGVKYDDFQAVEWTLYFRNEGSKDTPILERISALDHKLQRSPKAKEFALHHNVGSPANGNDYGPLETPLGPGAGKRIGALGGRPTNSDMSYFNVAYGNGGTMVVVGWPGQWTSEFRRDARAGLSISAGQELTHFRLHPGEEVRSPLIVLMDYKGDWIDGQNQWRRWMMAHGMPKPGGELPKPMLLASSGRAYIEMLGANEANQVMHIDRYLELGLKIDYWWMDAGWYIQQTGWPQVGTWEVDPKRFPKGFRPISDHAHAKGVKILVWFEPERVAPNTWLAENRPEWLLSPFQGLITRQSKELGGTEPCVNLNNSENELAWAGIKWAPHQLAFHPGPKGEYSVVRFTAPSSGKYRFDATFSAIDQQATTDYHVMAGGKPLIRGFIRLNGQGPRAPVMTVLDLRAGETLDFVVGYGNGDYRFDSTGLAAVVTGPDGKAHDAATEFATDRDPNGLWSYGWLAPGTEPDPTTFKPYAKAEPAGSSGNRLLNLGNPDAWKWLVEHVDKLIVEQGIDLYRQDFNFDPLPYWRAADAPDRQGITEIKHVTGYLAYWDELRKRHPNMLIDSCASGGRRNDLETMRRSVPLWRSDYAYEPIGHQCMTYGISMWLPYHGTGTVATTDAPYYGGGFTKVDPYAFWSNTAPSLGCGVDVREVGIDYGAWRRLLSAWRQASESYYGDFYPLTPWTRNDDVWMAWQYNRPNKSDGIVQVFRRQKAGTDSVRLKLRGLDPKATYRVRAIEGPAVERDSWTGKELMESGLSVTLRDRPAAAVVRYERVPSR